MEIISGSPAARVTILTDQMKFRITSELGDSNSDILSISTNKDMGSPSGSFNIVFTPNKDKNNYTWFDKLDAYDFVQIELKGINDDDPETGWNWRVVMRGLIDNVSKSESWEGGTPQRSITVNGRDFGCLLTDHQIYYIPELGQAQALEGMMTYIAWKNFIPGPVNAATAFNVIWDRFEEGLDLEIGGGPAKYTIEGENETKSEQIKQKFGNMVAQTFPDDVTNLWHLKGYEGAYWNAFAQYQDKPFHEIFVYDGPELSWLILRPSRLKDAKGNYHKSVTDNEENKTLYPDDFTFTDKELVSINVSKSQSEVFNYFITIPALQLLTKTSFRGMMLSTCKGDFRLSENPFFQGSNYYPAFMGKYGFRKYEATTYFVNLDVGQLKKESNQDQKDYENDVLAPAFIQKGVERNRMLVAWFLHNEFLLSGSIDISGTNKAVIGTYAKNEDDGMEYYVEGVSHSWTLFQGYKTSLRVTRGQPQQEAGGLVGWADKVANIRMNRYFFGGDGIKDVYGPVTVKYTKKEQTSELRYLDRYKLLKSKDSASTTAKANKKKSSKKLLGWEI
jgi:hypothetical protein